jgi:hypothetical protein
MPSNARRAAWRFDALWAVPTQLVGSTALTNRKCLLEELDSLLKRDLVECPTFPTYTSNVELKFKLSDLEVVLANACTKLPVTEYIQSAPHYNIDSGNLLHWFPELEGRLTTAASRQSRTRRRTRSAQSYPRL